MLRLLPGGAGVDATAEGLTLSEAAGQLGISKDTVRRQVKRGELKGWQVETKFGLEWRVALDAASNPLPMGAGVDAAGTSDLVRLLRDTQTELVQAVSAASIWQGRAELLAGELAAAREQVRALQAPQEEAKPGLSTVADQVDPPARRWWQRLLWGS
jgi:excisionase family DNA binding protein